MMYSFSTMICTPSALSQEGGTALGAQAGEARLKEVATKPGFTRFRRATETPFTSGQQIPRRMAASGSSG